MIMLQCYNVTKTFIYLLLFIQVIRIIRLNTGINYHNFKSNYILFKPSVVYTLNSDSFLQLQNI